MTAECVFRRVSDADMDAVLAFAAQIFADEQDIPQELNRIPADKQPQWWCMEQDGELVGTAAIYREGEQWHMGRITVAPKLRGQHKGTFLLKRVLDDVFAQDVDITSFSKRETQRCTFSPDSARRLSGNRWRSIAAMSRRFC